VRIYIYFGDNEHHDTVTSFSLTENTKIVIHTTSTNNSYFVLL